MSLLMKIDSSLKNISNGYVKIDGSLKTIQNIWTKIDGTLKNVYTNLPGPSNLIAGDTNAGYYGKATGIITGNDLISRAGIGGTASVSGDITWLKYIYKGKTLFVADRNISYGQSWYNLDKYGCVYGKNMVINNINYKCRLLLGGNADPATSLGREWKDLTMVFTPNNADGNWTNYEFFCQEKYAGNLGSMVICGGSTNSFNYYDGYTGAAWRPVLEVV